MPAPNAIARELLSIALVTLSRPFQPESQDLRGNEISSISASSFTGLTALTTLYLHTNQLASIPANSFTGLTALQFISLSTNPLTSIAANAFSGLSALTQMNLDSNQITSISANTFTGLTALTTLYLSYNQITSISANAFTGLTALTRLALNFNPVTTLPPGLFKGLQNGLYLSDVNQYLSPNNFTFGSNTVAPPSTYGSADTPYTCATCHAAGNSSCCGINCLACSSSAVCTQCYEGYGLTGGSCAPLACGTGGVCTCTGTLVDCSGKSLNAIPSGIPVDTTELYLQSNLISSIPANAFTGLSALLYLDISANELTSIPVNALTELTGLNVMWLGSNRLTNISATDFTGLPFLTGLYLDSNLFTSIPTDAFTGLTKLNSFSLSGNHISNIPANAFAGLPLLTGLYLDHNLFTSIPTDAFTGLTKLNSLDLASNRLASIATNTFTGLTALTRLVLNDNPLTTLPPGLFQGLQNGLWLSVSFPYLAPNNFTFDGHTVAPPSTYGSASQPYLCATCFAFGNSSCCEVNCLSCTSSSVCTQCYEGYGILSGSCFPLASIASVASLQSASSIASVVSATSALSASAASTASASAASVASSIAQHGGGGSQDSSSSPAAAIAAAVVCAKKNSTDPIYQEAVELTTTPLPRAPESRKVEDVPAFATKVEGVATVGQKQPEPLYEDFSSPFTEEFYDNESPYVAGSNSRRVREGLTIVKHLASGNFGDVALGQVPFSVLPPRAQNLLGPAATETIQVAVKSLKSNADEKSRKDFESEAKLMAPFVHPNVVRLLAALVESEPHLVLLEFVQYGDLRTLLQKSKKQSFEWTENEQVHAIRQIALGMEYLGTLHFVHRDLAARNCLVGQGMVVKIADFGLSRELTDEQDYYRMQTRGKLPVKWMAPETMTFRKFSTMSDVWSFGVTAWECCSYGATPYDKMEGRETLAHVEAGGRLPMPEHCTADLFNLMLSCWNAKPELRPSFSQLVKALNTFEDGTTIRDFGAML
ncbi:tyrosine-protein kinase transforming protein Fes [Capsaspora owczarzaki ATCC 30864]|uniref:tyrosine-protein kinase transforming protein Fes n=1 Tax=Capsaspora owczarzaki (strain ATCC 30864) TaxID=595528 RepID=UPI0001FE63E0|nr:tyrosine-protein kinase transforming protein Fes [Capsaspora owczarzaki ATCC 30864]|eukprot:XP_004346406.1 tyrosine-protein kinase transforming protein Fes [Capsaspora owczarzaki ATCC 30864]